MSISKNLSYNLFVGIESCDACLEDQNSGMKKTVTDTNLKELHLPARLLLA